MTHDVGRVIPNYLGHLKQENGQHLVTHKQRLGKQAQNKILLAGSLIAAYLLRGLANVAYSDVVLEEPQSNGVYVFAVASK